MPRKATLGMLLDASEWGWLTQSAADAELPDEGKGPPLHLPNICLTAGRGAPPAVEVLCADALLGSKRGSGGVLLLCCPRRRGWGPRATVKSRC